MDRKIQTMGQGSVLIANGNLFDPNFKRTLVLLCEHTEKGAYGLVLNRPTQSRLFEVFPDTPAFQDIGDHLYTGGPCELDRIQVLHGFDDPLIGGVRICEGVFIGGDFEKIARHKKATRDPFCRFYMGYSGWGPGQLENEMEYNSWIITKIGADTVFNADPDRMWAQVLDNMGDYYSLLAKMPKDPRSN